MNPTLPIILNGIIPALYLTAPCNSIMICSSLPKTAVTRLGTLKTINVLPAALIRYFFAFQKGAGKIRAYLHSMAGYFFGAATLMAAFQPENLLCRPNLHDISGGYPILTGLSL